MPFVADLRNRRVRKQGGAYPEMLLKIRFSYHMKRCCICKASGSTLLFNISNEEGLCSHTSLGSQNE